MNDVVVMTDPSSEEGSRPLLKRAVEMVSGEPPVFVDARCFYDGGRGRLRKKGGNFMLEAPELGLPVKPSMVVIYEIKPEDRCRFVSFQAKLAESRVASLGAQAQAWKNATQKDCMVARFGECSIPQMASIVLNRPTFDVAADAFKQLGSDVWTRPTIGCGGNDVFHVMNTRDLHAALDHYAAAGMDWLCTRDAGNFDRQGRRHQFRVVVLGDRVLRVCEHIQDNPDVPCNEMQGAVSTLLPPEALPSAMRSLAIRATRSLGLPFGGVDLAVENGGVVFEVNVHPVIDVPQGLETLAIPYVEAHFAEALAGKWGSVGDMQ